jgi:hypothetical protein
MRKSFYRTDYLYANGSFVVGMGSILSVFSPFYYFNDSPSERSADRTAIESDFGVVGRDIEDAIALYINE